MRDLVEGVLVDEREQEVNHRPPKRVFQAGRVGDQESVMVRSTNERGTAKLYLLELDRTVILSNARAQGRRRDSADVP